MSKTPYHLIIVTAVLATSVFGDTTSDSKEATSDSKETSSASKETSSASKETSSASKETTSDSKETTSASKETTSASKETTSDSKETSSESRSTTSPVQSAARPFKLDIAAPVQLAASDAASRAFQADVLPGMMKLADLSLSETKNITNSNSISLDPSKLVLSSDATLRVYFLSEGAGYRNSLGISTTGKGPLGKDAELIFPDASSSAGYGGSHAQVRTSNEPLAAGDFVNLGTYKAGTSLDFFLIANGAAGGTNYFSTDKSLNKDGIVHAVSLAKDGSAYMLISFEDLLGGGDKDYNDVLFAVEIGKANVNNLAGLSAPEPTLAMGSVLVAGLLMGFTRRRQPRS